METKTIVRVNNVDIIATSDEQMIAIRPICEALGIDANGQKQRIDRDEILGSVACVIHATGRDGKQYEMYCILSITKQHYGNKDHCKSEQRGHHSHQ